MPQTEMLRPLEAAKRLGISKETLRRWSVSGAIPSINLHNGHRRYDPAALEAYLAQHNGGAA